MELSNFDESQYKKQVNIDLLNNFINIYKDIETSDSKKPLFSLTKKYNTYRLKKKNIKRKKYGKN